MHGTITPTQRAAIERREQFRVSIAAKAAELADRKTRDALAAIQVAAVEAPLCREPDLFVVADEPEKQPGPDWFVVLPCDPRPNAAPTIREIQKAVCSYYDLPMNDLLSNRRTAKVVKPRQIGMYLAKTLTARTLPEIGRRFGGRDHTTVLHAVRKVSAMSRSDVTIAKDIAALTEKLGEHHNDADSHDRHPHEAPSVASSGAAPQGTDRR